jgi:hypothetical protein
MVQESVPMRFEYRVFVVGHVPVTGAGCVEERTPLDRDPAEAFDPTVREHRGAPDEPACARPQVRDTLVSFARLVAAELHREVPAMRDYVLDVALDDGDRPLVVELNARENAGFFACDPWTVVAALVADWPVACVA